MPASPHRPLLLGGSYRLGDDFRVRLRMARSSDLIPIRELLERTWAERSRGRGAGEPELTSLVQFDPRRRCVICATALIDSAETLVGVGSIDLDGQTAAEPDTLLIAEQHAEEIGALLVRALRVRAAHAARARAA